MRYEDVIAHEEEWFARLFEHYGFHSRAVDNSVAIAMRFSLKGGKGRTTHVRSGVPGEWRKHLSDEHIAVFKEINGDAALRLGYEKSADWT